jgi:hypothetical protein
VVRHEVDDKVVGSRHYNDGAESACEIVWVIGDRLILYRLEARTELIECISVFSPTNGINLLELGDVEGVSITVIGVSIVSTN